MIALVAAILLAGTGLAFVRFSPQLCLQSIAQADSMVDEKPGKAVRLLVQDETAQSKAFFTADVSCVTTWISRFFAGSAGGTQEGVLSAWNRRTANGLCTANAAGGKRNIDVLGIKIGVEVIWRWTAHFCIVSKKN